MNDDTIKIQDSYPPWNITEVLIFYFGISFLVSCITWGISLSVTRSILGISEISGALEDLNDPLRQTFVNINAILYSIAMMTILYMRVCKRYKLSFTEGFRFVKPREIGYFYLIPIIGVMIFAALMMKDFRPEDITQIPIYSNVSTLPGLVCYILGAITIAPIYEELFYRGYLYPAIEQAWDAKTAVVIVTGLFTLAHVPQLWGDWAAMFVIFCIGTILTVLRAITNSTKLCVIAHFGYNLSLPLISIIAHLLKR